MRLVAIFVVILMGAGLLVADQFSDRHGQADDIGFFMLVVGLLALGVELYVIPLVKWKLGRD